MSFHIFNVLKHNTMMQLPSVLQRIFNDFFRLCEELVNCLQAGQEKVSECHFVTFCTTSKYVSCFSIINKVFNISNFAKPSVA